MKRIDMAKFGYEGVALMLTYFNKNGTQETIWIKPKA